MKHKDKVIIITGGATGIGKATAMEFAKEGAKIVIADINEEEAKSTVEECRELGSEAVFVMTDVSKPDQVDTMITKTVESFGHLDFAFNNAGIGERDIPAHKYPLDRWDKILGINLSGVFYCMRAEVNQFLLQGSPGVIVNTSSVAGKRASISPGYTATKHGVMGLTKQFALEYVKKDIRVLAINPAIIETPIISKVGLDPSDEKTRMGLNAAQPIGRMGRPEEVAKLVNFLFSDDASYLTGAGIPVDGGYLAR